MVEIKEINLTTNEVKFKDSSIVDYNVFYDKFVSYWNNRIAGETISPFDMERFMKRGSSKNLKQLVDGKKAEGFDEASMGKKMNPMLVKMIVIAVVVVAVSLVALIIIQKMGLLG